MVTTFIGGDMDTDMDADLDIDTEIEGDTGMGFQFFTLKNLIAFFTIFAWSGLASIEAGNSSGITVVISILSGLLMMTVMASIFYFISRLTDSGTLKMNNAIGQIGTVYLPIAAGRGQMGQVQVTIQGALRTLRALTDDGSDLSVGTVVEVIDVVSENVLIVTNVKK
jgi:membrane protein implicated in regulation of membrane protease activity